jgi:hypothetical protein
MESRMLTYEDCLGLSELSADEIAAIARHEHLPEIVALELGAHLARSPQGRRTIRSMIEDDIAVARNRGDCMEAARLDLVLREFGRERAAEGILVQRVRALGFDLAAAPWVRRRVQAYLAAMGRKFGLAIAGLRERFPLEFLAAETWCAACGEIARCRRFLAGDIRDPDAPAACEISGVISTKNS